MIGQRHRRVADLGREQLHQEGGNRAVDHGDVDHHDEQDQLRHEPVHLALVGTRRRTGGLQCRGELRLVPALDLLLADRRGHLARFRAHRFE